MKRITFTCVAFVCLFGLSALSCSAQISAVRPALPERIWHFAGHHKELLFADALIIAAQAADSASSVHCQRLPGCQETNPVLGHHPDELNTWAQSMGESAGVIALNALVWHCAPDHDSQHVIWLWSGALAISQIMNVKNNADTAEGLQNGQSRSGQGKSAAIRSGLLK